MRLVRFSLGKYGGIVGVDEKIFQLLIIEQLISTTSQDNIADNLSPFT